MTLAQLLTEVGNALTAFVPDYSVFIVFGVVAGAAVWLFRRIVRMSR